MRAVQQPLAQKPKLLLEDLERRTVFEFFDFALRGLKRGRRLAIALEILGVGTRRAARGRFSASWMISASQLAATRATLLLSSGVTLTRSTAPGMRCPISRGAPLTMILVFSNNSGTSCSRSCSCYTSQGPLLPRDRRAALVAAAGAAALPAQPHPASTPRDRRGRRIGRGRQFGQWRGRSSRSRIRDRQRRVCIAAAGRPTRLYGPHPASRRRAHSGIAGSASISGAHGPSG